MSYIETTKPKCLADSDEPLYYMYANGLDTHDKKPIYREIINDDMLEVAYRVYKQGE